MIGRACPHYRNCLHNSMCMDCDGEKLYKPDRKEYREPTKKRGGQKTEKKAIRTMNNEIRKKIEKAVKQNSQRLTPNSGAGNIKGDSVGADLMQEMKERKRLLKGGNRSISIQKEWLEKLKREAGEKYFVLPFTFGEDEDDIYGVVEYDVIVRMYSDIIYLRQLIIEKELEIERLNRLIEEMEIEDGTDR